MDSCPECGRTVGRDGKPLERICFRLVRDQDGKRSDWGASLVTLAPSVLLCVHCIARFPLHDPLDSEEVLDSDVPYGTRGAVWTWLPISPAGRAIFERDLAGLPAHEAICGWPSSATCYLVTETLTKRLLPKTWALLQQSRKEVQHMEEEISAWSRRLRWLFHLFRDRSP